MDTEYDYKVELNEVWMDAEGMFQTPACGPNLKPLKGLWFVFGVGDPITNEHPAMVHPLVKVYDAQGKRVFDGDLPFPTNNEDND